MNGHVLRSIPQFNRFLFDLPLLAIIALGLSEKNKPIKEELVTRGALFAQYSQAHLTLGLQLRIKI